MLCPKCKQPIEGDEQYICCAGEELQWHCESCGKVSEGFAFPYGMCPLCGGKLSPLKREGAVANEALEAVRAAFEIELGGRAFYLNAAATATDERLRTVFEKLAAMEEEHAALLAKRYHTSVPDAVEGLRVDLAAIYAGLESTPEDPANMLKLAVGFEQRAVKFFAERAEKVAKGSAEEQLYKELAAEEREHVAMLSTEYARYREGKPGLL